MNKDQKRRDEIMCFDEPKYVGGLERFEELKAEQLETLIKEGFVNSTDAKKSSPTTQEYLDFMKANEGVWAHGFVITADRDDCRLVIDGLLFLDKSSDELKENFKKFCEKADDLKIEKDELYGYWD